MSGNSFGSRWTARAAAAAHQEKNRSENNRQLMKFVCKTENLTLEHYKELFRKYFVSDYFKPFHGMSKEEFIELLATKSAYEDGIISTPPKRFKRFRNPQGDFYIDAAFRSIRTNEVFMFTGPDYFVVKYDAQSHSQKDKENEVIKGPLLLIDGFHELYSCGAFRDAGVQAAFGSHSTEEAFLFSQSYAARIKYESNNEGRVLDLDRIGVLFKFLKDTKFSQGFLDAACESTMSDEAYLFKGSDYALINYSKSTLIREGRITDEFTCLNDTPFEFDIDSAFASHTSNQLYFFKDNDYVLIEFNSETKESHIIVGPEEIVPTNWPCLASLVPYKKHKNLFPLKPKTWEPIIVDGLVERAPPENCSLERNSSESKRKLEECALGGTMTSGSSSKSVKTVEDQQRRPRYSSGYIDAAFRSNLVNEVFMFTSDKYFVVKYDFNPRKAIVTKASLLLTDGFKGLDDTRFFTHGVDAAFGCHDTNTAFLFSGSWIAKIEYDIKKEGWVVELKDGVENMFPGLKDTKFSQGYLDAACESTVAGEAYLFKGSNYALINYSESTLIREGGITDEFTCLHNTLFDSEIDSAFASHTSNQLYFFKYYIYVLIEFDCKTKKSCIVAGPEEILPTNWLCLEGLLPYGKDMTGIY